MSDIFISYSRRDQEWVGKFAKALEDSGYSIWWDTRLLAGDEFHDVIPAALEEASCVIVVWSQVSVTRKWVRAEASRAHDKEILIPIQIESVQIPMPFNLLQAENMREWNGKRNHPAFQRLITSINRFCRVNSAKPVGELITPEPHSRSWLIWLGLVVLALSLGAGISFYFNTPISATVATEERKLTEPVKLIPPTPTPPTHTPQEPTPVERLQQARTALESTQTSDWKLAIEQLQVLAEQGNVEAWRLLGFAYYKGRGVQVDEKMGCSWYQKAKQAGNAAAKDTYAKLCL